MYIQIASQSGKEKKNNKIHDSPFGMVNAIYNANDVAFLKSLSGKSQWKYVSKLQNSGLHVSLLIGARTNK